MSIWSRAHTWDAIVIGGGVIGVATAWQLARLGAPRVLVLEQGRIGEGTTAQSSAILRTHYSVPQNVELAQRALAVYDNFAAALGDEEASCGRVRCGYLIAAPAGAAAEALQATLAAQRGFGIHAETLSAQQAHELLPIASRRRFDQDALIGFEPDAGYADAWLATSSLARAARRLGVRTEEGVAVTGLLRQGARITGVRAARGDQHAAVVVSAQNVWAGQLARWCGVPALPLHAERHAVLALQAAEPALAYTPEMPVFKDLATSGLLYMRSYGRTQMLVSEGGAGERLALDVLTCGAEGAPAGGSGALSGQAAAAQVLQPGTVSDDAVLAIAEQLSARFESYAQGALASSWTGVYDVTPDWNPVLGPLPGVEGLIAAFGFSGHGFKLAPAVGELLAQLALGLPTSVDAAPYALERFARGRQLQGRYGSGAVS